MQRRDEIVVPVLPLVVDRRAPLHDGAQTLPVERLPRPRRAPDLLRQRQRGAPVAIGHAHQHLACRPVQRQGTLHLRLRADEKLLQAVGIVGPESQDAGAREKRGVQFEGRIFRRRADENDRAVLHDRKKRILLRAIEAMDLVHEKQRLSAGRAPQTRRFEHLLEVGDAREDRRYLLEGVVHFTRQQAGDRRLSGTRRPPEDHGPERTAFQHPRERPLGTGQMLLPDDLGQSARAQAFGQRATGRQGVRLAGRTGALRLRIGEEIGHRTLSARPGRGAGRCGRPRSASRCARWRHPPPVLRSIRPRVR